MKGGASSAALFGETIRNTFGWNVMKPSVIGNDIWDRIYQVYVKDEFNLGIHHFFAIVSDILHGHFQIYEKLQISAISDYRIQIRNRPVLR